MNVDPADLSHFRAWAVNTPAFRSLPLRTRDRIRKAIGADPSKWTDEAVRYVEAGRKAFEH